MKELHTQLILRSGHPHYDCAVPIMKSMSLEPQANSKEVG